MHLSEEGFAAEVKDARSANEWAATTMLVAVAHVLRRPVALLASLADMAPGRVLASCAAVHLPARLPAAQCCPHPLLLAWGGAAFNHYVPLCRSSELGPGPALPPEVRPAVALPGGASVEQYIPVGCWRLNDTRSSQLRAGLLTARQDGDATRFGLEMLLDRLFTDSANAAKKLLCGMPPDEAVALLLDPRLMAAAEADPARLPLAALVQHAATRRLEERLTLQPHAAGLDARCVAAAAMLDAELPPRLANAMAMARLNEEQLQLELRVGQSTACGVAFSAAAMQELRSMLATLALERQLYAVAMRTAATADAQAAEAAAEAAAAKARADQADKLLLERLLQSSPRQPRWAERALAGCVLLARGCASLRLCPI